MACRFAAKACCSPAPVEGKPLKAWGLGLVSLSVSMQLQAGLTEFGAGLAQSVWRLTPDSEVECRLGHPIPRWGAGPSSAAASCPQLATGAGWPRDKPAAVRGSRYRREQGLGGGHGEKPNVASNEMQVGRVRNRRVVINMGRDGTIDHCTPAHAARQSLCILVLTALAAVSSALPFPCDSHKKCQPAEPTGIFSIENTLAYLARDSGRFSRILPSISFRTRGLATTMLPEFS